MNQQQTGTVTLEFSVTVTLTEADFARLAMTKTSSEEIWEKSARRFFGSLRRRGSKFTVRTLGRG
jgi:hypothetical protein